MGNKHLIKATNVEYLNGYRLKIAFDDGVVKIVDMYDILTGELLGELKDIEIFKQVKVDPDFGCLVWPNDADIATDALYEMGQSEE